MKTPCQRFMFVTPLSVIALAFAYLFPSVAQAIDTMITIDANGGNCSLVGVWDQGSSTCTLAGDVATNSPVGIILSGSGLTLDGAGHRLIGSGGSVGVGTGNTNGTTIRNVTVQGFWLGIHLQRSTNATVQDNSVTANSYGIWLDNSSSNTVERNTTIDNSNVGIGSWAASGNRITANTIEATTSNKHVEGGLHLYGTSSSPSSNNEIWGNNFLNNPVQAAVHPESSGNTFSKPLPDGGNYWSGHESPDDDNNGIVDVPVSGSGWIDYSPWRNAQNIIIDASGGDCTWVGTWNQASQTCTLSRDVFIGNSVGIWLSGNGVVLEGNGKNLTGSGGSVGVSTRNTINAIVRNLNIDRFWLGIHVKQTTGAVISANNVTGTSYGIWLETTSDNIIEGNHVFDNNNVGIGSWAASGNQITANTIEATTSNKHVEGGIHLYGTSSSPSSNNEIWGNDFLNNPLQAAVHPESSGNTFSKPLPVGGNYWSDWESRGLTDFDANGFVDQRYWIDPFNWENGWPDPISDTMIPLQDQWPRTMAGQTPGQATGWQLSRLLANPKPGASVDGLLIRAVVGDTIYFSSNRAEDYSQNQGWSVDGYCFKLKDGKLTEYNPVPGVAMFGSVFVPTDGASGKIYMVGQAWSEGPVPAPQIPTPANSHHLRNAITVWDLATDTFTNVLLNVPRDPVTGEGGLTDNNNEFVSVTDDGEYLIVTEVSVPGDDDPNGDSEFKNGGGLWRIPKSSIGDASTYERFYEHPYAAFYGVYFQGISKVNGRYYSLVLPGSTVQSSTDLVNWDFQWPEEALGPAKTHFLTGSALGDLVVAHENTADGHIWISVLQGGNWTHHPTDIPMSQNASWDLNSAHGPNGKLIVMYDYSGPGGWWNMSPNYHDIYLVDPNNWSHETLFAGIPGYHLNPTGIPANGNNWIFTTHQWGYIYQMTFTP